MRLKSVTRWSAGCLSLAVIALGCGLLIRKPLDSSTAAAMRNDGYSLLYNLVSSLKNVDKLLLIKSERPPVRVLIDRIAAACANAASRLETFSNEDPRLSLKEESLPSVERETRRSISSAKSKSLLFSGGKVFEVRLMVSQAEGLTYGGHLSKVIAKLETDPQRKKFLSDLSVQLLDLSSGAFDTLEASPELTANRKP